MSLRLDLKAVIVKSGYTIAAVNRELNNRHGTNLTYKNLVKKISNESMRYSDVVEILDVVGYKIVWLPKE